MSDKIIKITDSDFDSLVVIPKKPAVVCFSARWSGPSRMVRPTLETAADKYTGKVTFYELDVDENTLIPMAYGVRSVPAILFFAGGQLVYSHIGAITRDKLEGNLEKIAASGEAFKNMVAFSKKLAARFGV
jgi:thioredoxin 1